MCDNGKGRSTVVTFACGEANIVSVEEPSMCEYKMLVSLPGLCDHPAFGKPDDGTEQLWYLELSKVCI
jgi:hypothetical protein